MNYLSPPDTILPNNGGRIKKHLFGKIHSSQSGLSIIEVLVVTLVSFILIYGMVTVQIGQHRETRALSERLGSLDFERVIISSLSKQALCSKLLEPSNIVGGVAKLTFDATSVSAATPYVLNFVSAWGALPGAAVSPMSPSLVIKDSGGVFLEVTTPSSGTLHVNFEQSKLIRPIKDFSFSVFLNSSGPPGATTIAGCRSNDSGSSDSREFRLSGYLSKYVGGSTAMNFTWNLIDANGLNVPGSFREKTYADYPFGALGIVSFYIGNGEYKLCGNNCEIISYSLDELPAVKKCRLYAHHYVQMAGPVAASSGNGRVEGNLSFTAPITSVPTPATAHFGVQCELK